MKNKFHAIGSWLLTSLLTFTPYGYAQQPLKDSKLDERAYMAREWVLYEVSKVKSSEQFIKTFAGKSTAADQSELARRLKLMGRLPMVKRSENGLSVITPQITLKIEMQFISEGRFLVNGQTFTPNPKLTLTEQADQLGRLLKNSDPKRYSRMSLLLPEAHAIGPLLTIVLAGATWIATSLMNTATGHYGKSGLEALDWYFCAKIWKPDPTDANRNPKICKDYLKEKDELLKNAPENTAVKNALSNQDTKGEIFSTLSEKCTFETREKYYRGTVRILREQEGKNKKDDQVSILAEFDAGKLKHIKIFEEVYDYGSLKPKLIATYLVDEEAILTDIVLPKEGQDIKVSAIADLKSEPVLQAEQAFHKSIFAYIGSRFTACKSKKQEAEVQHLETKSNLEQRKSSSKSGAK